jgi:hypothetical protein
MRSSEIAGLLSLGLACGAASPELTRRAPDPLAFILVPRPPPVVPVEIQPRQPVKTAIWVEGHWLWAGDRWRWKDGGWLVPPEGASLSSWVYSYGEDGRVRFWPATWVDAKGKPIAEPRMLTGARRWRDPR